MGGLAKTTVGEIRSGLDKAGEMDMKSMMKEKVKKNMRSMQQKINSLTQILLIIII